MPSDKDGLPVCSLCHNTVYPDEASVKTRRGVGPFENYWHALCYKDLAHIEVVEEPVIQPSAPQIARFLKAFDAMARFEASQQIIRNASAFIKEDWPQMPDPSVVRVQKWLMQLANARE